MLTLDNSSITPNPRSIPAAGADVTISFRFRTNDAGSFTTRYTLAGTAFRLQNAAGGAVQIGSRNAPGANGFSDTLQIRAAGNTANQASLVIQLEIRENGQQAQAGAVAVFILHQAVAAFRATNNISQAALAARVGVARSTISRPRAGWHAFRRDP